MNKRNHSHYCTRIFNRTLLRLAIFALRISPAEAEDLLGLQDCSNRH